LVHLTVQESFHIHLHRDDTLAYIYSKRCPLRPSDHERIEALIVEAQRWLAVIPESLRNFQRAKHTFRALTRI
jgi:hypothetical protein